MKKLILIAKVLLSAVILSIIGLMIYVRFVLPDVGKPEVVNVELSTLRIERGRYLANSLCVCMDCHSKRDWNKFSGPLIENSLGQGGEEFNQKLGFPGKYYAKNITPFAVQNWTDGELLRAITCGVDNKGKALFPVMPYLNYGKLDKEDIYSIIAYIRTLTPIDNIIPDSESDFPMNFIINTIPQKASFSNIPDKNNKVAYGEYLFTAAACTDCHTQQEKGKSIPGMELAGGFKFPLITGGIVSSANITPDEDTGIGNWSEEAFVYRFKTYADSSYIPASINQGEFNSFMPWMMYSTMNVEDLQAIYAYLKTVTPVKNKITKFIPN